MVRINITIIYIIYYQHQDQHALNICASVNVSGTLILNEIFKIILTVDF